MKKWELREIIREELGKLNEYDVYFATERVMDRHGIESLKSIPLKPEGKKVLKGMKKEGFLDKIRGEDVLFYYGFIQNKWGDVKEKRWRMFMDDWKRNAKSSGSETYFQSTVMAYHVSQYIRDMKDNGEPIDSPYYVTRDYFHSFGINTNNNRIFNDALNLVEKWVERKRIKTA